MVLLEYVWIDAFGELRSKTKYITDSKWSGDIPEWNYDGSSTGQATGFKSDVILRSVEHFKDPFRRNIKGETGKDMECYLVMCDTYLPDGKPHPTNTRAKCKHLEECTVNQFPWFGMEQEYILYKDGFPYEWVNSTTPSAKFTGQGPYYCGVGGDRAFGRQIAEEHLEHCIYAGIDICGINAEVTPSQWEFQVGPLGPTAIGDHLWMARYILSRIAEKYKCNIEYHPKPMTDWNGSGCHTNFSTQKMREIDNFSDDRTGLDEIMFVCGKMAQKHDEHLQEYGDMDQNKLRLTGHHETASFEKFTYGISDRGASIRIPLSVANYGYGYLEDRRPASNADPYKVVSVILQTTCMD